MMSGARVKLARAFATETRRCFLGVLPVARRELRNWRRHAEAIPDPVLRGDALRALEAKHHHAEGAAAFAVLAPRAQRVEVARALVALQSMYNYLDDLTERPAADTRGNARRLHRAFDVALDPDAEHSDYYAYHPQGDDGGYLRAHVDACRAVVASLPSYAAVAPAARRAAAAVADGQTLIHAALYGSNDELIRWARQLAAPSTGLEWWELTAAATSPVRLHALVASAASPGMTQEDAAAIDAAYFPWISAVNGLLDGIVDWRDDAVTGGQSLVAPYPSLDVAGERIASFVSRGMLLARGLPSGQKHAVILAWMVCHDAAAPEASLPPCREPAQRVLEALGGLAGPSMLVVRGRHAAERARRFVRGRRGAPSADVADMPSTELSVQASTIRRPS
jgi:tetraprenyl-beta-curcumene synthase